MGVSSRSGFSLAYQFALDWLFPPRCAGCQTLGTVWCPDCHSRVQRIVDPLCPICGLPLKAESACSACSSRRFAFTAARAWGHYADELRLAILSLKHRRNEALGAELAQGLAEVFRRQAWTIDLLVPIPLAPGRRRQRGYNQVDLLARPFAVATGIRLADQALVRRHETLPQFEMNAAQRWENVRDAFAAGSTPLQGMNVLVMDDIMTSGATLNAAAQALKIAGAGRVYALTLARAGF